MVSPNNISKLHTAFCPRCVNHRLLSDDLWDSLYCLKQVNNEMQMKWHLSTVIKGRFSSCFGCTKVGRRTFKVLAIMLDKLSMHEAKHGR
jgi:hypothetical protein